MLKFRFFILFLSLFSCHQDPLKSIPENLRRGVFDSDLNNSSILDKNFLSKDYIQMTFKGSNDLNLHFKEGEISGHAVDVRVIYKDLPFDIDVKVDKNFIKSLKGLTWSYDKKSGLVIKWKPHSFFTGYEKFKTVKLPIYLYLKNKKDKQQSPLKIQRTINLVVEKTYEKSEIFKISYENYTYEKMEDGFFYRVPNNKEINLRLNRPVYEISGTYAVTSYSGPKRGSGIRGGSGAPPPSYSRTVYNYNDTSNIKFSGPVDTNKDYKTFTETIYDAQIINSTFIQKRALTEEVYSRLGKPIYERKQASDCASNPLTFVENGKTVCYVELPDGGQIPLQLDRDIYEAYYELPNEVTYEDQGQLKKVSVDSGSIYWMYQGEEPTSCSNLTGASNVTRAPNVTGVSDKSYAIDNRSGNTNRGWLCYVQVLKEDTFLTLDNKKFFYLDLQTEYMIKDNDLVLPISKNQFKKKFRLIPKHTKLAIAGYSKIEDRIPLVIAAENYNEKNLDFYIKDSNKTLLGPQLNYLKTGNISLPFSIDFESRNNFENGVWGFQYKVINNATPYVHEWNDLYLPDIYAYIEQPHYKNNKSSFDFFPKSAEEGLESSGEGVSLESMLFPSIPVFYKENHKPDSFKKIGKFGKNSFKSFNEISVEYLFPDNFYKNIMNFIPMKLNLQDFDSPLYLESLEDILDFTIELNDLNQAIGFSCISPQISKTLDPGDIFESGNCVCDPVEFKEKNSTGTVFSSRCKFNTKFKLTSKTNYPMYFMYEYGLSTSEASLREDVFNQFFEVDLSHYSINNDGKMRTLYSNNDGQVQINASHFFANLKPSIQCVNASGNAKKECEIFYPFQDVPVNLF